MQRDDDTIRDFASQFVPDEVFGINNGGNEKGNEMFVVYQLDRERGKMLYTQTRIGTKTIAPILPDVVKSFVGDAVPAEE